MILNKLRSRLTSKAGVISGLLFAVLAFLVVCVHRENFEGGARLFCFFYVAVITVFFIAQLLAFVVSHANYSEEVEQPKFEMLLGEEKEWENVNARPL